MMDVCSHANRCCCFVLTRAYSTGMLCKFSLMYTDHSLIKVVYQLPTVVIYGNADLEATAKPSLSGIDREQHRLQEDTHLTMSSATASR